MNHTKQIKRADGTRYEINVTAYGYGLNSISYNISATMCANGKRKFIEFIDTDSYSFRALTMEEREKYRMRIYSLHISKEEIISACLECWEKLKPTSTNLKF
jgi:hypothetical protein